jgi:DNA-binding CsgD family transcriptional regulator
MTFAGTHQLPRRDPTGRLMPPRCPAGHRPSAPAGVKVGFALRGWALVNAASVEAVQGREASCRAWAGEAARLSTKARWPVLEVWIAHVLGLLELGLGNITAAREQLTRCTHLTHVFALDESTVLRHEPDLIETLLADGDTRAANSVARRMQERADRHGSRRALAGAARCRAMVADEAIYAEEFQTALVMHDGLPGTFDRARTLLSFGERLRRGRRRADARVHLSASLAAFEQLDARPWADRAGRELRATVVTAQPRRGVPYSDDLTPQEQHVALIVAGGATVRETAAQLVLSPKTIEAHLGRAYRKLGVRNRAQLATRLAHRDAPVLASPAAPRVGSGGKCGCSPDVKPTASGQSAPHV